VRTPVSDPLQAAKSAARTKADKRFRVEILIVIIIIMRLDESGAPGVPLGLARPLIAVISPPGLSLPGTGATDGARVSRLAATGITLNLIGAPSDAI